MRKLNAHTYHLLIILAFLTLVTALPTELLAFGENGFTIELVNGEESEESEFFEDEVYVFGKSDHATLIITTALLSGISDFVPDHFCLPVPSPPPES